MTNEVGVLGDVHCNVTAVRAALQHFHDLGITTIFQVGDFGIYRHDKGVQFLNMLEDDLVKHGQTLKVLLGNREDYDYVEELRKEKKLKPWQSLFVREHIEVFPRVKRFKFGGRKFLAVTGAPSPDRGARLKRQMNINWWPQEQVRKRDVFKAISGGKTEILLTHDAPFVPHIDKLIEKPKRQFEKNDLAYALIGRKRQEAIYQGVRPKLQFHGHYHDFHESKRGKSMIVGLHKDGVDGNYGIIDLDTLEFRKVPLTERYARNWMKENTWHVPGVYQKISNPGKVTYEYTLPVQLTVVYNDAEEK